jgi:hypothetical protein
MAEKQTPLTEEEELAILFPEPFPFKVGSLTLPLMPMDLATCMRFATKARPIIEQMMQGGSIEFTEKMLPALVKAVADHPREAVDAMAIATGRSTAFIGKLPPLAAGALVIAIFRVNADFFAQSVGTLAIDALLMGEAKPGTDGAGLTH